MWRTATLACCSLLGCAPSLTERVEGRFRVLEGSLPVGRDGIARADVVPEGTENVLQVVAVPVDPSLFVHVRRFDLPDGSSAYSAAEELGGDRQRSNAGYLGQVAVLDWPITPYDPVLVPGGRHAVELGLASQELGYVPGWLELTVLLATDDEPGSGVLTVDLVHLGEMGTDPVWRAATAQAIAHWDTIFTERGITLVGLERTLSIPSVGAPTGDDAAVWRHVAATGPPGLLRVVVSPDHPGDSDGVIGSAGGIPGALVPTGRTGVRVTPERICGVDGVCDPVELRLYGETLAHEVGHHLGLFHPVETSFDAWDALPDTVECGETDACEQSLGGNLMFPYTVCSLTACVAQDGVTPHQSEVLHHAIAVD